jgi:hypothetical protein
MLEIPATQEVETGRSCAPVKLARPYLRNKTKQNKKRQRCGALG